MSCGVSLAHIAHGVCNPPKTQPLLGGWTRHQSVKGRDHNRRETSETILTSFTSPSLIPSHPFYPGGAQDRRGTTYLPTRSYFSTPQGASLSSPSSNSSSSVPLFFPPRRSAHFDTAEFLAVEADLEETTLTFVNMYIPSGVLLPLELRPRL